MEIPAEDQAAGSAAAPAEPPKATAKPSQQKSYKPASNIGKIMDR